MVNNLFIDLSFFVIYLKEELKVWSTEIDGFYKNIDNVKIRRVHDLERELSILVYYFEDAFNLRYINNYNFDEVSDFLITYNSSIPQAITALDNYFKTLYSLLVENKVARNIITRVNELQTTATSVSVNFSIYNIFEPGILFYCATKEIYTAFFKTESTRDRISLPFKEQYKNFCAYYFLEYPQSSAYHHRDHMMKRNPKYFLIDYARFKLFFDNDFKRFMFWHLSFIIQFPSIYDAIGDINKENFLREFSRLLFLAKVCDLETENDWKNGNDPQQTGPNETFLLNNCPKPQMVHIWNRTYSEINHFIEILIVDDSGNFEIEDTKKKCSFLELIQKINDVDLKRHISFYEDEEDEEGKKLIHGKLFTSELNEDQEDIQEILRNCEKEFTQIFNFTDTEINIPNLNNIFKKGRYKASLLFLTRIYLKSIYEKAQSGSSKFIIPSINRSWITGKVSEHKVQSPGFYYLFDPSGGAFFHSFSKSKEFSLVRNKLFLYLMHHSYLLKARLFKLAKKN